MTILDVPIAPEQELAQIARQVAKAFDPELIVLFGSRAYGSPNANSDCDPLILRDTVENQRSRWVSFWNALEPFERQMPIEPLILTPAELQERLRFGDQFAQEIVRKGVVLYARDPIAQAQFAQWAEMIQPMPPSESANLKPPERYWAMTRSYSSPLAFFYIRQLRSISKATCYPKVGN